MLRRAYRTLYRQGLSLEQACEQLRGEQSAQDSDAAGDLGRLLEFVQSSQRGIVRP